jgi:hypothetical protein
MSDNNKGVKILVSPGYGAGWSTWTSEHRDFALFDPGLIEMAERGASVDEVDAYIASRLGPGEHFFTGGWDDIQVVEVHGDFRVTEYDGNEDVVERLGADDGWVSIERSRAVRDAWEAEAE